MSASSPSLSARSASTSASKITSASQEHRINTYLTQNTAHTKGVERLIAFLDGHGSSSAAREESAEEDAPPSSDRPRGALQPAFVPSPNTAYPRHTTLNPGEAGMQQTSQEREKAISTGVESRQDRQTTPTAQYIRSSHNGEAHSPRAAIPSHAGIRPSLDSTKSEIERLQREVSSIQSLMQELQSSIIPLRPPAPSHRLYVHPSPSTSTTEVASPEDILSFIRHIDSLANLKHRNGDMRRDEDIFTKNNLQKLGVRIDAWEKIARNR